MDFSEFSDLLAWLNGLADVEFCKYPWLWVARAQAYFKIGNFKLAEKNLAEAERVLSTCTETDETMIHIQGNIAAIRSYLAEIRDDPLSAIQQAENALALLPKENIKLRSYISIRWANCLVWFGDFDKAIPAYKEAGEASKLIGDGQTAIIALSEMAVVQMFAGNLKQAVDDVHEIYRYAEDLALRDGRRLPAMGVLYRHMSHIKRELNELTEARYYAEEAVRICRQWGEKEALAFGLLALTRIQFAQGDFEYVDQNSNQIMQIAAQLSPKAMEQFQSWILHHQLLRGRIAETRSWSEEQGLTPNDTFGYEDRFEYQNYARLLAAQGKFAQAIRVIDMLHNLAVEAGDLVYTIQYKVLQAVTLERMNEPEKALTAMAEALSVARIGGYVRAILDEGYIVRKLLHMAISKGIETAYASQLLAMLEKEPVAAGQKVKPSSTLVEPLSKREMEVLQLLGSELNAPAIADKLIVSVSTIRSHIKNIYSKLNVHSRYEAVSKAKDLNLL
jgi:LuxR family maltose regulon positive regulatory protein